jgi:cysteinyl-tRNA synthetase
MELKLYNTLTRSKEAFAPLDWQPGSGVPEADRKVRMYVCGPTLYDFAHIGNARPIIVFDVLYRLLRHLYGPEHVKYVRNVTDVEDKINARAAERGISIRELTEATYANFTQDVRALGCLPPDVEPRATEHIEEMKLLIERLVASGHAYVAEDHVLFSVPSMPDYGRLSRRPLDEMEAGARVEVAPYKRNPMDFVLWKPSKQEARSAAGATGTQIQGEPAWPSPCGIATPGRPGWHIECSAMAWKHLGEVFDIHGGGIDLVFPHHENEMAQSRCAWHTPLMAQVWMHNGFLQVEGEKMAKSAGNFVTIRELLETKTFGGTAWHGSVLKLSMLMTHYRQPIDWTVDRLVEAREMLRDWIDAATACETSIVGVPEGFLAPLCDDLNTPAAVSVVRGIYRDARSGSNPGASGELAGILRWLGVWHGEAARDVYDYGYEAADGPGEADIRRRIDARNAARKAKDFAEADRIRDELAAMGVVLKDSKEGTTWEIAR